MFGRVVTFGRDNAADFEASSQSASNFAKLASVTEQIASYQAESGGITVTSRSAKLALLRLEMKNIARTAREIDEEEPGLADKFRMPTGSSQAALLASARKMVTELQVEGMVAKFVAYEISTTIVDDLETLLKEIADAKEELDSDDVESVENTAALKLAINAGKRLVDKLNAAMHNKYKNQPAKLTAWESASHVERAPHRKKTDTTDGDTTETKTT